MISFRSFRCLPLRDRKEGFTLVELLVVILIIGILLAIALPTFLNQQDKANNTKALVALNTTYKVARSVATGQNGDLVTNDYPLTSMKNALHASEPELTFVISSKTISTITPDDYDGSSTVMTPGTVYLTSGDTAKTFNAAVLSDSGDVCKLKVTNYSQLSYLGCTPTDGDDGGTGGTGDDGGTTPPTVEQTNTGLNALTPSATDNPFFHSDQWSPLTSSTSWNSVDLTTATAGLPSIDNTGLTQYSTDANYKMGHFQVSTTPNKGWYPDGGGVGTIEGGYWSQGGSISADGNAGFATEVTFSDGRGNTQGTYVGIWAAMQTPGGASPADAEDGYQLSFVSSYAGYVSYVVVLTKWVDGTPTIIGTYHPNGAYSPSGKGGGWALVVNPSFGTVTVWHTTDGSANEWASVISADDDTYDSGYAGVEGSGGSSYVQLKNFAAGALN